jgi:uncharacterized membrane protein YGL010W
MDDSLRSALIATSGLTMAAIVALLLTARRVPAMMSEGERRHATALVVVCLILQFPVAMSPLPRRVMELTL